MAGNILGAAFAQYGLGSGSAKGTPINQIKYLGAQYEYALVPAGRTGIDTDGNGLREVDCSVLVYNALRNAGYYLPGTAAGPFTTKVLFEGSNLTELAKDNFSIFSAEQVKSGTADLKPGDILMFKGVNGGTSQHIAIFYGYDNERNPMFYGSQTSTGPGVATLKFNDPDNWWNGGPKTNGKSQLIGALRPKEALYISETDLTGGQGTGLSSPNVIAAVNLLKQSNVEGYRANIYSNADGVPTVGNGLTFVVKGSLLRLRMATLSCWRGHRRELSCRIGVGAHVF